MAYSDDDFEEYEDDFEPIDSYVPRNLNLKDQSLSSTRKANQRNKELLALIQLDEASFDLLNIPPSDEYTSYLRRFGRQITQTAIQTGQDNRSITTQTDDWKVQNRWSECPPNHFKENGVNLPSPNVESPKFLQFLRKTSHLIDELLGETLYSFDGPQVTDIPKISFLKDANVVAISADDQSKTVCLAYVLVQPICKLYYTFIAVYRIGSPYCIGYYACFSKITNVKLVYYQSKLILIAGTIDGSIQIWNLNKSKFLKRVKWEESTIEFNTPTSSTDMLPGNHQDPICGVFAQVQKGNSKIISVDTSGNAITWALSEEDDNLILYRGQQVKKQGVCIVCCSVFTDSNLIVATDTGLIFENDKRYRIQPNTIVHMEASPFLKMVVVSYANGEVHLFFKQTSVATWILEDIQELKWSYTRPAVFYAISNKILYEFNILDNSIERLPVTATNIATCGNMIICKDEDKVAIMHDEGDYEVESILKIYG